VIRYLILGVVQGLTEFLPVSSSGHLVLAQRVLHLESPGTLLEATLHLGTLIAVLFLFRRDIVRLLRVLFTGGEDRRQVGRLAIATVPIALVGFLSQAQIERAFSSALLVGVCLLVTAGVLLLADRASRNARRSNVRLFDAVLIGLAQAAALLPGISRSGVTIGIGLLLGVHGVAAARFSFLLAVPAILGAGGYKLVVALGEPTVVEATWAELLLGAAAAALVGVLAIKGLLAVIAGGRLKIFGVYCAAVGAAAVVVSTVF